VKVVRALLLAVLALALAIAPAAPCTMGRQSTAHRHIAAAAATHLAHAAGTLGSQNKPDEAGIRGTSLAVPAAAADEGCPGHRHRPKHPPCPATCCPLACQAALPTLPWASITLEFHPSERVLIVQVDGAVDAHPLRIERPPRRQA